jgi:hypothetical protein
MKSLKSYSNRYEIIKIHIKSFKILFKSLKFRTMFAHSRRARSTGATNARRDKRSKTWQEKLNDDKGCKMMIRGNERKPQQRYPKEATEHPSVLMGPPHDLPGPQMQDVIREARPVRPVRISWFDDFIDSLACSHRPRLVFCVFFFLWI